MISSNVSIHEEMKAHEKKNFSSLIALLFFLSSGTEAFSRNYDGTPPPNAPEFNDPRWFVRGNGYKVSCDGYVNGNPHLKTIGPRFVMRTRARTQPKKTLRFMFYNFLNLATSNGRYQDVNGVRKWVPGAFEKTWDQMQSMYQLVKQENPDAIFGSEIESLDSMEKTNAEGFGGAYTSRLIPDYDERINLGAFYKDKEMPFDIEIQSYREVMHNYFGVRTQLYSRDAVVSAYRKPGSSLTEAPFLVSIDIHGKSMRDGMDKDNLRVIDPKSEVKSRAQFEHLAEIVIEIRKKWPNAIVIVGGDNNRKVEESPIIQDFKIKTGLLDIFDVVGIPPLSRARATHSFFPVGSKIAERSQLDAVYIHPEHAKRILKAYVAPHRTADGKIKPLPATFQEREKDDSDHFPIVFELLIEDLVK